MKTERFISGIYNYCDYWCDRCAFTRRCRNFLTGLDMEREDSGTRGGDDATQQVFWNRLADRLRESAVFGSAADWGDEIADSGWDDPDPEYQERKAAEDKAVEEHPLTVLAEDYRAKVHVWLEMADGDLKNVARQLLEAARSGVAVDDYEEQAREIGEMIEVVAWYHTLIPSKLSRAVHGLVEEDDGDGEFARIVAQSRRDDANGTGKVVLAAVERSSAAWVRLREILPNREDEILALLALLSRLQRGIHAALPGAKAFIRPGFDERV